MTRAFSELGLHDDLLQAVAELGYTDPMPIQTAIIPLMLAGDDVIGQAQTGTGKTAAFALPILQHLQPNRRGVQSLILAPTRELALQVAEAFSAYGKHRNVRVLAVYGGQPYRPQISALERGVDVVVGTPGRLIDLIDRKVLNLSNVRTLVLDEADEMLSMGFIEDIETILTKTPAERQTALFSATMPAEILRLAERYLRNPQHVAIQRQQMTAEAIEQRYYFVHRAEKLAALARLLESEALGSSLVFVRTREDAGVLAAELARRGYKAEALSGDLSQEARERTLQRFRQGDIDVVVATDVAARGLDIEHISHVFNIELPDNPEVYIHRIGRTGRAGKTGIAISLVSPAEKRRLSAIESLTRQRIQRGTLPSEADVLAGRQQRLLDKVKHALVRGGGKTDRAIIAQLASEGHDPLDIAAAILRMARGEEYKPLEAVTELAEFAPRLRTTGRNERGERNGRQERDNRSERNGSRSDRPRPQRRNDAHEAGMVRLSLNKGRKHGLRPNDVVGAIAYHADIPGSVIGKILIDERFTLVDVPERLVTQVLDKASGVNIRGQAIALQRA